MDFSIIREIIVDWVNWLRGSSKFFTLIRARLCSRRDCIIQELYTRMEKEGFLFYENLRYFSLTSIIHASNRLN